MKANRKRETLRSVIFALLLSFIILAACTSPCMAKSKPLEKIGHFLDNFFEPIEYIPALIAAPFIAPWLDEVFKDMFSGFFFPSMVYVHLMETQFQYKTALLQNIKETKLPEKTENAPLIPDCSSSETDNDTCGATIYMNTDQGTSISGMPAIKEIVMAKKDGEITVRLVTDQDVSSGKDANGNLLAYGIILIKNNEPYMIMYCAMCTHKPGVYPRQFILQPNGYMKNFKNKEARVEENGNTIEFTILLNTIPTLEVGEFVISGGVQAFTLMPNGDLVPANATVTPFVWTGRTE